MLTDINRLKHLDKGKKTKNTFIYYNCPNKIFQRVNSKVLGMGRIVFIIRKLWFDTIVLNGSRMLETRLHAFMRIYKAEPSKN